MRAMTQYSYVALDVAGREKRGRLSAESAEEVRATLKAKKLYVLSIGEGSEQTVSSAPLLSIGRKRLNAKQLTLFTRQLATLARVSPLEESLRTIARQTESDAARGVIESVHAGVLEGRSLADAMQKEAKSFPQLYRAMVSAGETAGSLPTILDRLADLQERQTEAFAAIVRALALAYRAGPPGSLGDEQLTSLALEGRQLVRNWAERDCEPTSESGLQRLLEAHERIAEDLLLAIDEIVWPYFKLKGL